jgi:hypothetical protein
LGIQPFHDYTFYEKHVFSSNASKDAIAKSGKRPYICINYYLLSETFIRPEGKKSIMEKISRMSDREKQLLNVIGRFPDLFKKELVTRSSYQRVSTIVRKITQFKGQGILYGPFYRINYNKLCKNPLRKLFCILELSQEYEQVISYLKLIDSMIWAFLILSTHKTMLAAGFFSSDNEKMKELFQLLQDADVISNYIVRSACSKQIAVNPHLFGEINPCLTNLLDPCDTPDMSFDQHDTDWNTCDISILPYLEYGVEGAKLMAILKHEEIRDKTWTYEQVRYSRDKMVKNKLIEKMYMITPFLPDQCAHFYLYLKTDNIETTRTILCNFARGERVYREFVLCEEWGLVSCMSHPLFLTGLLHKLDQTPEITEMELYPVPALPTEYGFRQPLQLEYFDIDKQILEYPYQVYEKKIREKIIQENIKKEDIIKEI